MQNVNVIAESDGKLLIEIDTTQSFGLSKSEKSVVIASTQGNADVKLADGRTVKLGLNCYTPA